MRGGCVSRQSSPLLTAQSVGVLRSPAAKAVTVGQIRWKLVKSVYEGLVKVIPARLPHMSKR